MCDDSCLIDDWSMISFERSIHWCNLFGFLEKFSRKCMNTYTVHLLLHEEDEVHAIGHGFHVQQCFSWFLSRWLRVSILLVHVLPCKQIGWLICFDQDHIGADWPPHLMKRCISFGLARFIWILTGFDSQRGDLFQMLHHFYPFPPIFHMPCPFPF